MTNVLLLQTYDYEWKVHRGDSVFTPAIFIGSMSPVKFRFEIRTLPRIGPSLISVQEIIEIYGHKSNLNAGVKLNIQVWLYYSGNNTEILYFFQGIEHGSPERTLIGTKTIQSIAVASVNNPYQQMSETDHFKKLREFNGNMTLKCRISINGHLDSFSSLNQKLNSYENRIEFARKIISTYETQLHSDIKIMIEDQCLSARKHILTAQSPVFEKMLHQDFLESKTNTITIKDCGYEVFDVFLKFMHTGEISDNFKGDIEELYAVADKYDVGPLRKECVRIMARDINLGNVCKVLRLAYLCGNNGIKSELTSFVIDNFCSLEGSTEWADLIESTPRLGCEIYATVRSLSHFP